MKQNKKDWKQTKRPAQDGWNKLRCIQSGDCHAHAQQVHSHTKGDGELKNGNTKKYILHGKMFVILLQLFKSKKVGPQ